MRNSGSVENKGFEIDLYGLIVNRQLKWEAYFNFARNKNEVTDLGGLGDILIGKSSYQGIVREGEPLGSWYGWASDGIWTQDDLTFYRTPAGDVTFEVVPGHEHAIIAGDPYRYGLRKYKDISGPDDVPDGVINDLDRVVVGRSVPKFFGGMTNSFTYKGITLSFFLEYSYGRDLWNYTGYYFTDTPGGYNHFEVGHYYPVQYALVLNTDGNYVEDKNSVLDPGNPNGEYPIWSNAGLGGWLNDQFIEDASYIRLRDLTIAYNLPENIIAPLRLSRCQVFIKGSNLFTITNYSGNDPAVNANGNDNAPGSESLLSGKDWSAYPIYRTYSFGLNLSF
jgi:hypothetical protein